VRITHLTKRKINNHIELHVDGFTIIRQWLHQKGLQPFPYQEEAWRAIVEDKSGLINAPTGYGKTYAVFLGVLIQFLNDQEKELTKGARILWISPLRSLAKDLARAMQEVLNELKIPWQVGIRNGDTSAAERQKQQRRFPQVMIVTPESLHLLLAQKSFPEIFKNLKLVAIDEWHELVGTKRGVQVTLALSRFLGMKPIQIWGISATIGNLQEAKDVLLYSLPKNKKNTAKIITTAIKKHIEIQAILPDEIEKYPWAGHLGLKLVRKVVQIIEENNTSLLFINTRGMSERWYQAILAMAPHLAGALALHHGSIDRKLREWIEDSLHTKKLKAVVCTSSLDLGVDFRPVDTVIQVGSPKGVARFLQRAGRSGHGPGEKSKIYFVPTHSLELMEVAALKKAIKVNVIESPTPRSLCFDVLIQYLCTLAIGIGFLPESIFKEIKSTYCYATITEAEWQQTLAQITVGGKALREYDEFKKIEIDEKGLYFIKDRMVAMRHRMNIGTIISDSMIKVKLSNGKFLGMVEEWFISRMSPGDVFTFAGRNLEFIHIKDMAAQVKPSSSKKSIVPSWNGGRMPLSANMGLLLRETLNHATNPLVDEPELKILAPILELQKKLSHIPKKNELLVEYIHTKDGYHLFVYPFEGRLVHEAMASLLAGRISKIKPMTFSLAMNDYSFELLSDQPIPVHEKNIAELLSEKNLLLDIQSSVNANEMSKRKFREIASIGGLVFQGLPGKQKKARHIQASTSLIFKVLEEYEPDNILIRQAYQEVFLEQMEEERLRATLQRIQVGKIIITTPHQLTPFCFPVKVDSLRETISSEHLEDRIRRMIEQQK